MVALRAAIFLAALQAAGVAIFLGLFGRTLAVSTPRLVSFGRRACVLALVLLCVAEFIEPARLAGAWQGVFDLSLQRLLLGSDVGATRIVRTLGLVLLLVAWWCTPQATGRSGPGDVARRLPAVAGIAGVVLVLGSFALMGHTVTHHPRWLLSPLLLVHVSVIAFWFGALLPLCEVASREAAADGATVVARFSRLATWLVPLLFFAGLGMAVLLLPNLSVLLEPYGELLLTKVALFALLMLLAALNKWRLGLALATGGARAVSKFCASALTEWCLIVAVLGVTATMTSLFSPTT